MFNWFKKTAVVEKVVVGPDVAVTRGDGPITPLAVKESEALKNRGNAHLDNGKLAEAAECFRQAIARNPRYAEAYTNLGLVFQMQGNLDEAIALYRKAVMFKPSLLTAHMNLGIALVNIGQADAAEESLARVLALDPAYSAAMQMLCVVDTQRGVIAAQSGDFTLAENMLRRALERQPNYIEAHVNLGNLLQQTRRLNEAEALYRRALELQPDNASAHYNLGNLLKETRHLHEAEASYRRALELKPDYTEVYVNLGNLLVEAKRLPEAEASYRRVLELKPDSAADYSNLGNVLLEARRLPEAEASYRRALELRPDFADARTNLGILLLSLGRYVEGWPYFEHRYDPSMKTPVCEIPDLPYPQWKGESLVGKSIVIWSEQGFGDCIQFARYTPLLKERGASRITLVCFPPLKALLETVVGVDAALSELNTLHDYWTFPLSLPLHFGTTVGTIPSTLPYLHALPARVDRWRDRLPKGKFRVGLVWKGNAEHLNDANRSLPGLTTLASLWSVPGVEFVSLQKGQGEEEAKNPPADQPIIHLGSDIGDFADTAAIIDQLDLVICVDTSIAHLAGAMAKPCWVLLPAISTDWRWLQEREDSPWYPSLCLFRQKAPDDWSQPVERIRQELMAITHAGS